MTTATELINRLTELESCCLARSARAAGVTWDMIESVIIAKWKEDGIAWHEGLAECTDSEEFAMARLSDGSILVYEGSEDYTGHG